MRISLTSSFRAILALCISALIVLGVLKLYETIFRHRAHKRVEVYIGNETYVHPFPDHGERIVSKYMEIGEISPNCGLDEICPDNHFPVHIYTGKSNNDMPKICVAGKYVIQKDINNGGRGLNMVIIDTHRMRAVNARRFDTYSMDSSELEMFLAREVRHGDILIGMTFDEASKNLGTMAKNLLADLGSSEIQNLQFRSQWYMITQNGMNGGAFTPYEEIQAPNSGFWAPIEKRFCVPRHIHGRAIAADPPVHQNKARMEFCSKHSYIKEFCAVDQKNTPLKPAILTNRKIVGNPVFTTPIMILAGHSIASLSLTLETVISQPGIQIKYVNVVYNPKLNPHVPDLCALFGFSTTSTSAIEYWKLMDVLFRTAYTAYSGANYIIVLEEGLLLAPDFLSYFASMQPLFTDKSILGISAWNPNGYANVSSRSDVAYRISDFPGQGFMIRMETYIKELQHDMKKCCNKRGWEGNWLESERWERDLIIPELSRVLRRPVGPDLDPNSSLVKALFYRIRATNLDAAASIKNIDQLRLPQYMNYLQTRLKDKEVSLPLKVTKDEIKYCHDTGEFLKNGELFKDTTKTHVISFKDNGNGLKYLAKCFGLFYDKDHDTRGSYHGILRFAYKKADMFLISNKSPLFKIHPFNQTTLIIP